MPLYNADVWGAGPRPENFQKIEAEDEQEAKQKAREFSRASFITNIEVEEARTY